jgi:hypothetical protein
MRHIVSAVLICFVTAGLLGMGSETARADTPTPTLTPTATATRTAGAPGEETVASFMVWGWVDAWPSVETVTARIGNTVCGRAEALGVGDPVAYFYSLDVASHEAVPGCGKPGDLITFFIGDKQANQTAEWQPGQQPGSLTLVVGPPFARFAGNITLKAMPVQERVIPFIGDVACGYQLNPWMGEGPTYSYGVVVYAQELRAGCGTDGAEVTFKLVNESTREVISVAVGGATWHAMGFDKDVNLVLAEAAIEEIPVAGGGTGGEGASGWWVAMLVALVVLGGGAIAGAGALRGR